MKSLRNRVLSLLTIITLTTTLRADEGMWLYTHLASIYPQMKSLGLRLSQEDIYSINQACLKDAVVSLRFCTAELVSSQGLMLTNHHCAYDAMQYHTDTINNYLDNGFWARSHKDELSAQGMTASILIRLEDVTSIVNRDFGSLAEDELEARKSEVMDSLVTAAIEGTDYDAYVADMFAGNQHVLFVYITYKDVRLVGVPPQSIGKFGGDTDNWEWPRHTGDFALLRVYTDPDGKPADYSEDNIPLVPKHYFPVSIKGVEKGDYAMVMGFPGGTDRYSLSYEIEIAKNQTNPQRIKLRDTRLRIWKESMDANKATRVKYASKYAQVSNYWKYFIGQNEGLARLKTIDTKRESEKEFMKWVNADAARKAEYGSLFSEFESAYEIYRQYDTYYTYLIEGVIGIEALEIAWGFRGLGNALMMDPKADVTDRASRLKSRVESHFKDYHAPTDQRVFAAVMKMVYDDVPADQKPKVLLDFHKKFKGNWEKAGAHVFAKSIFVSEERCEAFLKSPRYKTLKKDPAYQLSSGLINHYIELLSTPYRDALARINDADKLYLKGLLEMNEDKQMYPDANSTPRLTYGKVIDYFPRDAVQYMHYTTTAGVLQKEIPDDDEFHIPADFSQMLRKEDFGSYGKDGELAVCFITDNDITGGNSGSPVLNADGHLIGIAFDGNWEAMTGDLVYDAELKRCINVDIRYVLFVIDKYAGAQNIIGEMTIVE